MLYITKANISSVQGFLSYFRLLHSTFTALLNWKSISDGFHNGSRWYQMVSSIFGIVASPLIAPLLGTSSKSRYQIGCRHICCPRWPPQMIFSPRCWYSKPCLTLTAPHGWGDKNSSAGNIIFWIWSQTENNIFDEFSENFQTASDPPPLVSENYVALFATKFFGMQR